MIPPRLSLLVPTLNEAGTLPLLLADARALTMPYEVIVADGGSTDATLQVAAEFGASVVTAPKGRGVQLAAAARNASASVLLAIHADVRIPRETLAAVDAYAASPPRSAIAFSLCIEGAGRSLALVEAGANLRSRVLKLPYGDQGLLMTRAMYEDAGGYEPVPIMEDVLIARALARTVGIRISDQHVMVSARRWARDGVWQRTFRNVGLLAAFLGGVSPSRIARWYR